MYRTLFAAVGVLISASAALPCSLCGADFQNRQTLRQEIAAARIVVVGTLRNARLISDATGEGRTDLSVEHVIKGRAELRGAQSLTLPRYYPGGGDAALRGVFFFDVRDGRPELSAGRTVRTESFAAYLKSVATLIDALPLEALPFFARQLDHVDDDAAADAFFELARAADADIARCGKSLPAARLRQMVQQDRLPPERLGLAAFLLACAGEPADAELLHSRLRTLTEERQAMRRGLLAGVIVLKPQEGWALIEAILADPKRSFLERYAVMGVLEFFHNWRAAEDRAALLRGLKLAAAAPDLADMAIENLRRWEWWDLTKETLGLFARPGFDGEMIRRAIVRYALSCPEPAARRFTEALRRENPEYVREIAATLEDE